MSAMSGPPQCTCALSGDQSCVVHFDAARYNAEATRWWERYEALKAENAKLVAENKEMQERLDSIQADQTRCDWECEE